MIMRLPTVGSQYLMGFVDADKNYLDGGKTYKVTLAAENSRRHILVVHRCTTIRRARCCRRRSASRVREARRIRHRPPLRDPDGSTTVYFGPSKPADVKDGNWIQTMPGKGWFTMLRLYSPQEPFFRQEWRPSEIELVR